MNIRVLSSMVMICPYSGIHGLILVHFILMVRRCFIEILTVVGTVMTFAFFDKKNNFAIPFQVVVVRN